MRLINRIDELGRFYGFVAEYKNSGPQVDSHGLSYEGARKMYIEDLNYTMGLDSELYKPTYYLKLK